MLTTNLSTELGHSAPMKPRPSIHTIRNRQWFNYLFRFGGVNLVQSDLSILETDSGIRPFPAVWWRSWCSTRPDPMGNGTCFIFHTYDRVYSMHTAMQRPNPWYRNARNSLETVSRFTVLLSGAMDNFARFFLRVRMTSGSWMGRGA